MTNRGRAQKGRGYRCEKRIEARLAAFDFTRQAMSGALGGDHAGDLARLVDRCPSCGTAVAYFGARSLGACVVCHRQWTTRTVRRLECKHRDRGWPVLRKWLAQGAAHALVLDEGARAEPLVVLTLATFAAVLREAGYGAVRSEDPCR